MGFIAHRIKGACCCCGVPKFEGSIRKLDRLLKSKMVLEAHPSADTQQDTGINAVMTIVNHDADRLIEWHLSHRNAFFNQVDDQEQAVGSKLPFPRAQRTPEPAPVHRSQTDRYPSLRAC